MPRFRVLATATAAVTTCCGPLAADVFVSDIVGDAIRWYSDAGTLQGTLTGNGIDNPYGMTLGPDGLLYVANAASRQITRHNPATGAFVDIFIAPDNGNLSDPDGVAFGRDGNLYVTDFSSNRVLRYDGDTGSLLGPVTASGLSLPIGIATGPDGDLFVTAGTNVGTAVLRIDGDTGASEGVFATLPSQGWFPAFDAAAHLYTPILSQDLVHESGPTGDAVGAFASVPDAIGIAFLPNGDALVSSYFDGKVYRLDGTTGAILGEFVSTGPTTGGSVLYVPEPASLVLVAVGGVLVTRRRLVR